MSATFNGEPLVFLECLRTSLPIPQYIQPAVVTMFDQSPTNYSGKVDGKAISELQSHPREAFSRIMPQANGLVAKSREIWLQVLCDTPSSLHIIDSDTDFFHVGGSSISMVELQAEINKGFNTDMPLIQLFENSTLGTMARQIDPATGSLPASTGLGFTVPAPSNNHEEPSTVPKLDCMSSQIN